MGIFDFIKKRDVLYFPGCIAHSKFEVEVNLYGKIFSKLGIGFVKLDSPMCSGLEPWESGYDSFMRQIMKDNLEVFKEMKIKKIITTSPGCYNLFAKEYPEILPYWDIEVLNLWKILLEKLKKKFGKLAVKNGEVVTYHDSCYLGRYSGIYDEPREILEILGYKIREMDNTRDKSFCCGSCGGLVRVDPGLARKVARERVLQAKRVGVNKMVVVGFENYDLLKSSSLDLGIEILELSEVLAEALGIKVIRNVDSEELIEVEEKILAEA